MKLEECCRVLEIDGEIDLQTLKERHKTLVRIFDPDKYLNDPKAFNFAAEKLREINTAYECMQKFLKVSEPRKLSPPTSEKPEQPDREDLSPRDFANVTYHEFIPWFDQEKSSQYLLKQEKAMKRKEAIRRKEEARRRKKAFKQEKIRMKKLAKRQAKARILAEKAMKQGKIGAGSQIFV